MAVLSEWDIIKELGKGILIYPFAGKNKSLRGCDLCLTASKYACAFIIDEHNQEKTEPLDIHEDSDSSKEFFRIPKRKTTIVWTEESVWLSNFFCGSLHSKVKLVSKGIGHIGTRVNPNYGGVMARAIHNLSDNDIRIDVSEVIAYLRVYKLSSKSSFSQQIDDPGKLRDTIPEGCSVPPELIAWLNDKPWKKGDEGALREALKQSPEYKEAQKKFQQRSIHYRFIFKYLPQWDASVWFAAVIAVATVVAVIVAILK